MKKGIPLLFAAALAALCFLSSPSPAAEAPANALLVVPSETAFDRKFQDYLEKKGAKLLESHPPSVFVGHIPQDLDRELEEKYGAKVYREKVDDWASFARYGENAVFAVNAWNKRFVEDPPVAPLVVSSRVQKAGRRGGLRLAWNDVMKAASYRLQISRGEDFSEIYLETGIADNQYLLYPSLLEDGIYYWRVAPVVRLNTGEYSQTPYSSVYNFAVSNRAGAAKPGSPAAPAQAKAPLNRGAVTWQPAPGDRHFRLQLANTADFDAPLADVFTDTCTYRLSGLPVTVAPGQYLRFMGSDGRRAGEWSAPIEIVPGAAKGALKKKGRAR
ncbi:MAG: hypothetical protein CVU79_06970 [Elusimicrobia bacterium HGW-Elusimicrobia-3]|nr:MAG: hypothetical protein CVU79_06970 [Elusimicrobia bacterium HGW-Elusimicrobia-3]